MLNLVHFVIIALNVLPAASQLKKLNPPITVEKFIESKCTKPGQESNCEVIDKLCSNGAIIDSGCLLAYDRFCKEFSREQTTQCAKLFQGSCASCVLGKPGNDPSEVCEELFANKKDKACRNLKKAAEFFKTVYTAFVLSAPPGSGNLYVMMGWGTGLSQLSRFTTLAIRIIEYYQNKHPS